MALGVNLPVGPSATQHFGSILHEAATRFQVPAPALSALAARDFKGSMGRALIEFEAQRAIHPQRVQIADFISRRSLEVMQYQRGEEVGVPLSEHMQGSAEPLPVVNQPLGDYSSFTPELRYERRDVYKGPEIERYTENAIRERKMTHAAAEGLNWVSRLPSIDLRDRRVVLLGGGAELIPAEIMLRGGATALWIDLSSPENFIRATGVASGTLVYPEKGANLLEQPLEIAATIERFSEGEPVDILAFAYAGKDAREWRLTAAMNAVIRRLPPEIVRSFGCFVSPTSVCEAEVEDMMSSVARAGHPSLWQEALAKRGFLKDNLTTVEGHHWVDAMDPTQGGSYLAAQYLEKRLAAERYAVLGLGKGPVTVSPNVAGISRTKNMQTPTYRAGFVGAPHLGLSTYDPDTTRWQNGMLLVHDLLNPEAPGAAGNDFENPMSKAQAIFSEQIHGGIYSYPYALLGTIGVAVAIGSALRPWLIPPLVRSMIPSKKKKK